MAMSMCVSDYPVEKQIVRRVTLHRHQHDGWHFNVSCDQRRFGSPGLENRRWNHDTPFSLGVSRVHHSYCDVILMERYICQRYYFYYGSHCHRGFDCECGAYGALETRKWESISKKVCTSKE